MIDIIRLIMIIITGLIWLISNRSNRQRLIFLTLFLATLSITNDLLGFSFINFIFTTQAIVIFHVIDFLVDR